jgi:hypothetical protein
VPEDIPASPTSGVQAEAHWPFVVQDGRAKEIRGSKRAAQFYVCVMLAFIENRVRCVGVEVRSYERTDNGAMKPLVHRDGFTEIGSALWRSIPIGDLIERSIAHHRKANKVLAEMARSSDTFPRVALPAVVPQDRETLARIYESRIGDEPEKPRRGPERLLSIEDLATVVAPAYLTGGRKPVVAVRDALSKHKRQPISMDQARKAVVRAREAGVLAPAKGRGKP